MHDIVRDYCMAAHTPAELKALHTRFVQSLLSANTDDGNGDVRTYTHTELSFHVAGAITHDQMPKDADLDIHLSWILHADKVDGRSERGSKLKDGKRRGEKSN